MPFALHPQLDKDCVILGDLPLCRILIMNNRHFPWLVLVPRRENMREIFDLPPPDYAAVMEEVRLVARKFAEITAAHKMNVAALGNAVPQLHIHVIARFTHDAAWPGPVWNANLSARYEAAELAALAERLKSVINLSTDITKM